MTVRSIRFRDRSRRLSITARLAAFVLFVCPQTVKVGASFVDDKPPATQAATQPIAIQPIPAHDYSAFTQSYHLPFANPKGVDFDHLRTLQVRVSINGGPPVLLQVDTGSVGVIVGAADVPNIDPRAPAGSITYSSSGLELDGVWTPATVAFLDAKDEHGNVATAYVPVLAAQRRQVHPGAVNSLNWKPTTAPIQKPKVFMLGIGTGRGPQVKQYVNPWVNLKEMQAGTMRRGYQITHDGIELGLAAETIKSGYIFAKLKEHTGKSTAPAGSPTLHDWDSPQGWIALDGKRQVNSDMLIDTGLTNMMIEGPEVSGIRQVDDGTPVLVNLLGGRVSYTFTVGDLNNPVTPRKVTWVHKDGLHLVNTGLRALALFDYLYDADGGYAALRPVHSSHIPTTRAQ